MLEGAEWLRTGVKFAQIRKRGLNRREPAWATPGSVLIGGALVLAFAVAAWRLKEKFDAAPAAA
jgi:hypothetical protein